MPELTREQATRAAVLAVQFRRAVERQRAQDEAMRLVICRALAHPDVRAIIRTIAQEK
jgi:hypothetical protein